MNRRAVVMCGAVIVLAGTLTAAPAEAGASPAAGKVRAAKLTWTKCGTDDTPTLQCASLEVPLNHAKPHGRRITLALTRVPHTSTRFQGPLLVNPGGPGQSGLWLAGTVASGLPEKVAAQYDIIGFDPRGVGSSKPALDCKPGYFAPTRPAYVPSDPAIEKANLARAKSFADACGEKYADVLPYISTISAAKDMDSIREAVGAKKINYLGYSGGTYLGAVYGKLFPQRMRRMVLDSMVDPTTAWYDFNFTQDSGMEERFKALMAWIAKYNATYELGTDPAAIEAKWYAMRAGLARKPAGGKVGASELDDTFLAGGYGNDAWPYLARAFAAYVNDKSADHLVKEYEFYAEQTGSSNAYSIYTAIECGDAAWPRDWNQWRKDNWAMYKKAPFYTWSNAWFNAPCAFWPTKPHKPMNVANAELPPLLLFQATNDGATPYEGGVTVHRLLKGSSLVVEQGGENHTITLRGNACLDEHLASYLSDGTVPRGMGVADAVCQKTPDPKPLSTANSSTATAPPAATAVGGTRHGMHGLRG
ncbi:alpha/beta hydrolase [Streptomyces sp. SPB162]|uniref:alpha/beta hydrolase n=1 Tax=Streptomyces sp. SPB162 TaxID=2940560 RepID=UPI002407365F|nr:alpha/beta hydrolase [Streptomyces sp. SPB162]MDF9811720.1 pimeloyl-ACP methyl ester carboxylesterase [Streptomyces sp. SPB162]